MSRRTTAVIVGILFVVQMVSAMVGTTLIQAFVDGATERAPLTIGVLFMMCSGLAVAAIGLLMYPVLKVVNQRVAIWYPVLRFLEFAVSAIFSLYLLIYLQVVPNHLLWIYIPTGLGGLVLNYLLFISGLVPRWIAVLGLVGYGLFLLAVPLDLLGVLNMNQGLGMIALVPGFLYELLVLPIWLITKGFKPPSTAGESRSTALATTR